MSKHRRAGAQYDPAYETAVFLAEVATNQVLEQYGHEPAHVGDVAFDDVGRDRGCGRGRGDGRGEVAVMAPEGGVEVAAADLTELVGDVPLPCFYAEWSKCGPGQAQWVMHVRCPACGCSVRRLSCGGCKAILETSEAGVTCPACDEFTAPARFIFALIESL